MFNVTKTNINKNILSCTVVVLISIVISHLVYAQTPVEAPSGIIAWWPFDEIEGTIAEDRIGNHPGAHTNGTVYSEGKVGGCLRFDGSNDYVAVADSDLWAFGSNDFTIELWANFDNRGGGSIGHPGDIFIGNDEGPGTRNKWFFALGGGVLNFHIHGPSTGLVFLVRAPFSPVVGRWYHLAVTRRGSTYTIYVDGMPVGSAIDSRAIPNAKAPLTIGQAEQLGFMNGCLDEVTIYNRALTEEEIRAIYDAGSAGKRKELRIRPDRGGDTGRVTVTITGGMFEEGATVLLMKEGEADIVGDPVKVQDGGRGVSATFDLTGVTRGTWGVVIANPNGSFYTMSDSFIIEEVRPAEPWVDIVGLGLIRPGRPQSYYIFYGNRGNVDAGVVPIWISGVPAQVSLVPAFELTELLDESDAEFIGVDEVPFHLEVNGEIVIPLIVPMIAPGESGVLEIVLTVPSGLRPFTIRTWANPSFFSGALLSNPDLITCIVGLAKLFLPPNVECGAAFGEVIGNLLADIFIDKKPREVGSYIRELAELLKGCTGVLSKFKRIEIAIKVIDAIFSGVDIGEACGKIPPTPSEKPVAPITSFDPNKKFGSQGSGEPNYVSCDKPLIYSISFENLETATAPAQEVFITDHLDPNKVDLGTLSLGIMSFGNKNVVPPSGRSNFATDVDLRPDNNLVVRIVANLNPNTGILTWYFSSLDPETGNFPDDPLAGFLPPNVNPPEGDGSVLFTVMPKEGLPTGTEIRNSATIVFDVNPPIDTNDWINTIDNTIPESEVLSLEPVQTSPEFEVQWFGTDEGAGIRDYTIYVSQDDGPFTPWITDTNDTSALFSGEPGKTYMFYSVARDQVGNREVIPLIPDTITRIEANRYLTISVIGQGSITEPGVGSFEYSYGQEVSVTAVADPNFKFCRWEGTAADANAVITYENDTGSKIWVTIDNNNTLTAVFDEVIYNIPLDSDPGWPMDGEWEFGIPKGQNCNSIGNPDPNSGHTGSNVIGVNLDGCYNLDTGPLYDVVAGPFNLSDHRNVKLRFWRWLNTDFPEYIEHRIEMSLDGNTWSPVWIQPPHTEITDGRWIFCEYPMSGADCQPTMYLRWTYQVRRRGIYAYTGWNIDDIQLTGCQDDCQ